jgi:uncharacterized membrane protein YfcA
MLGQGGGIMLMAVLPGFVPAPALIGIHSVVQATSNGSRACLSYKEINWPIIWPVAIGTVIGASLILPLIPLVNWQWMQGVIAFYILWLTWGKFISLPKLLTLKSAFRFKLGQPFIRLGVLQGSLGMALGATGPLGNALLLSKGLSKDAIVASNAVIMLISHLVKILFFSMLGLHFFDHALLLLSLCVAAIIGSLIGSRFRNHLPEKIFFPLFKGLLTLLALRMLFLAFY